MTGEIGIDLFSVNPVETTAAGSLVTIAMHVHNAADVGATGLSFVTEVNPNGHRAFQTMVEDAQDSGVAHTNAVNWSGAGRAGCGYGA